jgi:hypothetical protein
MKSRYWLMLVALALSPTARALDPGDVSPYDKHPECLDTKADSSSGDCIIQDGGTPRHRYPPPGPSSMSGNTLGGGSTTGAGTTSAPSPSPAESNRGSRK